MKNTINKIAFKLIFEKKYSENIIDNTILFLDIVKKYKVKTIGIGYWMNEFKKSYSYVNAFYKDRLDTSDNIIKIENNCFCDDTFRKDSDTEFYWKGSPKVWQICHEFERITKLESYGAGNDGQHQFHTDNLINGIWKYSNNNWNLINN